MKRLMPFIILCTTALAALMVIIIQPQQTTIQKKRMREMRSFLLAQVPIPGNSCYPSYEECMGTGNCNNFNECMNPSQGGGAMPNESSFDANAAQQQQLESECLGVFDESPFGAVRKQTGLPTTTRLLIKTICVYGDSATTGKFGGADLDAARNAVLHERDDALRNTPRKNSETLESYITKTNNYLQEIKIIFQEFSAFTQTADYLISPLPSIQGDDKSLHEKIKAVIQKYIDEEPRTEVSVPVKELLPEPTPQNPESFLSTKEEPAAPRNFIIRTFNTFINILKNIRDLVPQQFKIKIGEKNQKIVPTTTLKKYYHDLRIPCAAKNC